MNQPHVEPRTSQADTNPRITKVRDAVIAVLNAAYTVGSLISLLVLVGYSNVMAFAEHRTTGIRAAVAAAASGATCAFLFNQFPALVRFGDALAVGGFPAVGGGFIVGLVLTVLLARRPGASSEILVATSSLGTFLAGLMLQSLTRASITGGHHAAFGLTLGTAFYVVFRWSDRGRK